MKTLVVFYSGCIEFEVMLAVHLVGGKWPVIVATPDGQDYQSRNGMLFRADYSFASVPTELVKCLLIPGGDPAILVGNESLNDLVKTIHKQGSAIGAICAGPFVLAQAGR